MNILFGLAFLFAFQSRSYLRSVLSVYFIIIIIIFFFLRKDNAKGISLCGLSSLLSLNEGVGC